MSLRVCGREPKPLSVNGLAPALRSVVIPLSRTTTMPRKPVTETGVRLPIGRASCP